jgi:hypothetical protein
LVAASGDIPMFYHWHELPALLGTPLVDEHMEKKLANVHEAMFSLVTPRKLLTVTYGYDPSCIFCTDGSLIEGCAGFAFHKMGVGGFGHKIQSPAGVFTALDTLLGLNGLRKDVFIVLFSLIACVRSRLCCLEKLRIRLTLWCMNVNNCAGACARTELR